jgi:hypothetical protein
MIPVARTSVVSVATKLSVQLTLRFVETDWLGLYDRVEVYRSRLTDKGPFEELTGTYWMGAELQSDAEASAPQFAPLVGKTLNLLVQERHEVAVTFTGVDPLGASAIAMKLETAGNGLYTATEDDGVFSLLTAQPGAEASIRVVGGDAAPILGFSTLEPGAIAFGKNPRIPLVEGTTAYSFLDPHGDRSYFYRTRFRNSQTDAVSEYSDTFSGKSTTGVDPSQLVLAFLDLVDGAGRPLANRNVLIHYVTQYLEVSGKNVIGSDEKKTTDENGRVEFYAVRGVKLRVAIAGTNIVREVTAPTDAAVETFSLFDGTYGTDDVFVVQRPNVDYAVRRSL